MNQIVFQEDSAKLKKSALIGLALGAGCMILGIVMLVLPHGYAEAAFGGAMAGGGGAAAFMAFTNLQRASKPPRTLVYTDTNGIVLTTGENATRLLPWSNIRGIHPISKGVQRGVAFALVDDAAFAASLTAPEQKFLRDNKSFFGTFASVRTNHCPATNIEIANAVIAHWLQATGQPPQSQPSVQPK